MAIERRIVHYDGVFPDVVTDLTKATPEECDAFMDGRAPCQGIDYIVGGLLAEADQIIADHGGRGAIEALFDQGSLDVEPIARDALDLRGNCLLAKHCRDVGDLGGAMVRMYHAGRLAERIGLRPLAPDVRRGRKVLGGAKAGNRVVHGTKSERDKFHAEIVAAFKGHLAANPHHTKSAARVAIAEQFGVSAATIRRYTTTPRRK